MEQPKVKFKIEKPKDGKITIELTDHEASVALAWMEKAASFHAAELQKPGRETRRALKRGALTRADLREFYENSRSVARKIVVAMIGVTEEELSAVEKFIKELDKDKK